MGPLSKLAPVTVAIVHCMWAANDSVNLSIYIHHRGKWTLLVGPQGFRPLSSTEIRLLMAASFVAVLLCIVVFLCQRRFI